jgi:LPXTG-site transpeptidase (sortase) family protein
MRSFTRLAGWLLMFGVVGLIFAAHRNWQVAASLPPASTPQDSWRLLAAVTNQSEERLFDEGQILSSAWESTRNIASQKVPGILQVSKERRPKLILSTRAQPVSAAEQQAKAQPETSQVDRGGLLNNLPLVNQVGIDPTPSPSFTESRVSNNPVRQPSRSDRRAGPGVPVSQPAERLRIPSLHINVPVVVVPFDQISWNLNDIQQEVAQLGSLTGEQYTRNLVLAGHVTLQNSSHGPFRYLHWLEPGDLLIIETSHTIQTYRVREQIVVKPEDVSVTENTPEQQLTLITCTDWSEELKLYQRRRVVLASLVSIEPKQETHK